MTSRRRILAFLGLVGAPAALWSAARAQSTAASAEADEVIPISCNATDDTPARLIAYRRDFHIDSGKLVTDEASAHYINQSALKTNYANGTKFVKRSDDPEGFNVRAPNFRIDGPDNAAGIIASFSAVLQIKTPPTDIIGQLTLADGTTEDAYVKFVSDMLDPTQTQIDTQWQTVSPLLLTKPVKVELIADGSSLGTFGFDMSKIDWTTFVDYQEKRIRAADNVTYDSTSGATTVEGCSGGGDAGCFFTTAAVDTLGLGDDCWELRTLRRFRDGPLARTAQGRALTARYYDEAPRLVAVVNRRAGAARVWLGVYWTYIVPCALLAQAGLTGMAVAHYGRLFARLEAISRVAA